MATGTSEQQRHTGTVTQFDIDRGFGFVSVDGQPERAFCHVRDVRENGVSVKTLHLGARLEFRLERGEKSPKVKDGKLLEQPSSRGAFPNSAKEVIEA